HELAFGYLIEYYRDYLIAQMKAPRCADNYLINGRPVLRPKFIADFNKVLERYKPNLKIDDDQIIPLKIENEARFYPYWQTPRARALYRGLYRLRYGSQNNPITESGGHSLSRELSLEERRSLKWQQQLREYLDEFYDWKPEHEKDESDYFHQKCRIYSTLLKITPKSYLFDRLVGEYLAFLTYNRFDRESFIEWYMHVKELHSNSQTIEAEAREMLLEAMRTSDDQVIRLQIRLMPYFEAAEREAKKRV